MPAPTLSQQGAIAAVTTGDLAITLPAYTTNDIVVITTVGWIPNTTTGTNTQSLASPWTKYTPAVTSGNPIDTEHAFWWARATSASSLGTTVTITRPANWDTGTDTCWAGRAYVINGCVTTGNPYDELAATALSTAANPQLPAITVSGGNRLALIFMTKADNSATPTAATGYTVGTEVTTNTGTDAAFQTYRQTTSANITAVTPTGGAAPAQGDSVYFEVAFVPAPVTATAAAPLGSVSGSGTAVVTRSATAASSLGSVTGSATATVRRTATAAAPLGAVSSTATARVTHIATADAPLGSVTGLATATITPTVTATATAPLGAVTSTASATITHTATGSAPLGALDATATAAITHSATAAAPLGTVTASSTAVVSHTATGDAALGSVSAAATATIGTVVIATAPLGATIATATATVTPVASASAPLGAVTAAASATVTPLASAAAALGAVIATATATVTPPTPPTPTGGGSAGGIVPRRHIDIRPIEIPEQPAPREPQTITAFASTSIDTVFAFASAEITWVAADDDAEVLLLL